MFKNAIIYRIGSSWQATQEEVEEALQKAPFLDCGATQEKSMGWVPPRGEDHGALAESINGQWILKFRQETKSVPGSVLARKVAEKAARIERETGRKPGKKETRELKEEAKLDLLPYAFTKLKGMWVWIDIKAGLLVLDTSSQGFADTVVSLLVELLPGLSVALLDTKISPPTAMSEWLSTQEPPTGFSIDRECELKSNDESKAGVRYARHPLDIDEIRDHVAAGKIVTRLALTWDDRVSFTLTNDLKVTKMKFMDTVFDGVSKDDSGFDVDVAILTGELSKMIPNLIQALGGEGREAWLEK
ncbi:exonuclease recombination-associated [Acidovorax phage ACP17]|uniref:DNA recombination-dependent growth factor C n=1 Tax=Acidovorax phage ACP17 TaxID=2010329 RepID=A0A218M310_9CAUD|nr:exonuclease recombination-associated [Acidovorax phage ACP17]ASD50427.1 DNA recombination-dependent growth factor C [Acidovorax phage ACP17]